MTAVGNLTDAALQGLDFRRIRLRRGVLLHFADVGLGHDGDDFTADDFAALHELRPPGLLGHVGEREHRRAARAVEEVGRQHGVAALGDPVGHLLDARAQPERVHQKQDAGVGVFVGAGEVGVGDAVRHWNFDG